MHQPNRKCASGQSVTLNYTLQNTGPSAAANVVVTDWLPDSTAFLSAAASKGSYTNVDRRVVYSMGTLNNGTSASFSISFVPTNRADTWLTNWVSVTSSLSDLFVTNNSVLFGLKSLGSPPFLVITNAQPAASGQFGFRVKGFSGPIIQIEAASDLIHWTPLATLTTLMPPLFLWTPGRPITTSDSTGRCSHNLSSTLSIYRCSQMPLITGFPRAERWNFWISPEKTGIQKVPQS